MSEAPDQESKTEEPTEKKIRESLEKGKIPISREAPLLASMCGLLIVQSFLLVGNAQQLIFVLRRLIDDPAGYSLANGADAVNLLAAVGREIALFLWPIVAVLAAAGLASSLLQNTPRIVFDRIQPDLSRLSIGSGWKRIFGSQGLVEFGKAVFKLVAVSFVVATALRSTEMMAVNTMVSDPAAVPELILTITMRIVSGISIATIVLVGIDLLWARFSWRRELRMTRQELKDEFKQVEGDPIIKTRLRSLARDRARRRMIAAVPRASVVIANPTHYAIALKYVRGEDAAPVVLAKGKDLIALKIREIAEQHNVPVVENKPLARSLYDAAEVERMIPAEFFRPVAEIVYYLHTRGQNAGR